MAVPGEQDDWAARFEEHRPRLHALSLRMLGSTVEADDAVQEVWLRLDRTDPAQIENLGGWLTTVAARICLNLLRARAHRREESLDGPFGDWVIRPLPGPGPEDEAVLADSVGLALLVVLDTLSPAERLAFVLHDLFGLAFDEIAPLVDRSPAAARQLASRARRRVQQHPTSGPSTEDDSTPRHRRPDQRRVVEAFLAASRSGDLDGLVRLLDPDIVLRVDDGTVQPDGRAVRSVVGADAVAGQAMAFARLAGPDIVSRPALVGGAVGVVSFREGRPFSVLRFEVAGGAVVGLDILADPVRLAALDLAPP